ncbi:MAG TPA: HAMP domain-containing sensor histidine kinase [Gemmatimonadaceae bacterium]|nr:HAMP domain-containing sensor histidine kinase [Gemmatimonadaceae bacterium]
MNRAAVHVAGESDVERFRGLTEIGRALTHSTSAEQVAQLTVERGAALLGAAAAVLMLADADSRLHVHATHGVSADRLERFAGAVSDETLERLKGLLDAPDDGFLAVPLIAGGSLTGLLAVARPEPAGAADEWLLSALADQVAVALETARHADEVHLEMEQRLRASEGATGVKDRALSMLAHDIRSPLGAIDGYCSNMEDEIYGPVSEPQRRALGRVRMAGRHLLSLLENVMEMVRIDAGVVPITMKPVRLAEVAREAVDLLAPAAVAKLQTLTLAADADVVVRGDQARIRQVLVNLLGNAVKFTPQGGSIALSTAEVREGDALLGEIRVADTGPGIAEAERAAVFEPYYRSEGATHAPGVGLGLAISHALVTRMGGALTLDSVVGEGTTFILRFPASEPAIAG